VNVPVALETEAPLQKTNRRWHGKRNR
jgi:hypothetical protein